MESVPIEVREREARALKALFEAHSTLSQAQFGKRYAIGNASMVWQYLNGRSPLNIEAATKFAAGLGVRIEEFSPRLAKAVRKAAPLVANEPQPAYHQEATRDDVALSDVLKHGTADDRRRVLDDIRMQLVRARAKYTNEEFSRYLDALDALDQPNLPPSHERRRSS